MASISPMPSDPQGFVAKLLSFDSMIGGSLIKIIYFVGLGLIALGAVAGTLSGLSLMAFSFATGLGTILLVLIGSGFGVLVWRFSCELWILLFRMHDLLVEIRDKPTVL